MPWLPKRCVVVPVDFSEPSFGALESARELVKETVDLRIINVLPVLEPTEPGVIWTTVDDKSRRHHVELAIRERLKDTPFKAVELEVRFGDPGHEIADYAQTVGAELIVMPSHGRTGISRLLIGSVAERVVRLAHCPVLVLKH